MQFDKLLFDVYLFKWLNILSRNAAYPNVSEERGIKRDTSDIWKDRPVLYVKSFFAVRNYDYDIRNRVIKITQDAIRDVL